MSGGGAPGPLDPVSWDEHVHAAMRWAGGALRRLHGVAERETVDDALRIRAADALAWLETARREAFRALEKMGTAGGASDAALELSAVAEETKARVLALNADWLESLLRSGAACVGYGDLLALMRGAVSALREKSAEIREKLDRSLKGPPK